jgi:hypothetical protein
MAGSLTHSERRPPGDTCGRVTEDSLHRSTLRVAALVDGPVVERWIRVLLDAIQTSKELELALVMARDSTRRQGRGLYRLYETLDRRLFGSPADALAPADVSDLLHNEPVAKAFSECGPLDVLLDLTPDAAHSAQPTAPRYGVWAIRFGGHRRRAATPYFWEIFDGDDVSGAVVEMLPSGGDRGHVLFRALWATDRLSPHRNRVAACWRIGDAILARLLGLQEHGLSYMVALPHYHEAARRCRASHCEPSGPTLVRYLAMLGIGLVRRKAHKWLLQDQWCIAYRRRRAVPPDAGDLSHFELLMPPRGRFFADPFVIERKGRHYVFVEEYSYRTGKGVISCIQLGTDRPPVRRVVLERDYHLSYPFVFTCGGEAYMIPETADNSTVELYRALEFPNRWTLEAVLIEGVAAVDSTLLRHDGRLWLFANVVSRGRTTEDELFLFSSDSLRGPWVPHPMNPIVSDVRAARPAGRIFTRDGRLIRPGQDSSPGYGHAITLRRIEELSEVAYREVTAGRIEPHWLAGNRGTHTYNFDEAYEVLDARRQLWRRGRPRSARKLHDPVDVNDVIAVHEAVRDGPGDPGSRKNLRLFSRR